MTITYKSSVDGATQPDMSLPGIYIVTGDAADDVLDLDWTAVDYRDQIDLGLGKNTVRVVGGDGADVFYGDFPKFANVQIIEGTIGNDNYRLSLDILKSLTKIVDSGGKNQFEVAGAEGKVVDLSKIVFEGAGTYAFQLNDDNMTFIGTKGNDVIQGWGDNLTVHGGDGNDIITGRHEADQLYGDAGNDDIFGEDGDDYISGGAGDDTLGGGAGDDEIHGGAGADKLYGIDKGKNNDGFGADWLIGGVGDDEYYVSGSEDIVDEQADGGSGKDTIYADISYDLRSANVLGAVENLILTGVKSISGWGNSLNNEITGTMASNKLYGLDGDDTLDGQAGEDQLYGGNGKDTLIGGAGIDYMAGGKGDDTYFVDNADEFVDETGGDGKDTISSSVDFALNNTEHVFGSVENLTLTGSAQTGEGNGLDNVLKGNDVSNTLNGFEGNDEIHGGLGDDLIQGDEGNDSLYGDEGGDVIYGGDGNDLLDGGAGQDIMRGEEGNDIYVVDDAGDVVDEEAGNGTDLVQSSISFSLSTGGTAVLGEIEDLTLTGTGDIDGNGNALANKITGNAGVNQIYGYAGNDVLDGGAGNDRLNGGNGNDKLIGGLGNDELTGGKGKDHFVFSAALNASTNLDTIKSFSVVDDTIDLKASVFTKLKAGALSVAFFKIGEKALDKDDYIIYDSKTGALSYDADGNGVIKAVQFAKLDIGLKLTASDFLIFA